MNTNDQRAEARFRASRRLRTMTIGSAILGVAATGGLGWAAALTYNGALTQADLTASVVTPTATTGTPSASASTSGSVSSGATVAPSVTSSTGSAHVATGGS